jgi:hypothetical protein
MIKYSKFFTVMLIGALSLSVLWMQGCKKNAIVGGSILTGIITDVELQVPVNKIKIVIKNSTNSNVYTATTDSQGRYQITCEPGYYNLIASKSNYLTYERNIIVGKGKSQEDFYMSHVLEKPCILEGTITDAQTGKALTDATVQIGSNIVKADQKGKYKFDKLPEGQFNSWISVPGYDALNEMIKVTRGLNVVNFKLKKMGSKSTSQTTPLKRNAEFAANPTFLEDYKATDKRIIYPKKDLREYNVVVENRFTKYVKFDEKGGEKGEIIVTQNETLKNDGKGWKKIISIDLPSQPDDVLKFDLENVLTYFNFQDPDIIIEPLGTEKLNGYDTKKFRMHSKPGTLKVKTMDVTIWIIVNNPRADLNHVLTRVKGMTVPEQSLETWADIDLVFYDIGKNNKVSVPTL